MAYILEKYSTWTFDSVEYSVKDGNLNAFEKDDLLRIITLYWMTNSISSSVRYYRASILESADDWAKTYLKTSQIPSEVAVAVHYFKNELFILPSNVVRQRYRNLKQFKVENSGGHFAAFQNPIKTAHNMMEFVQSCLN